VIMVGEIRDLETAEIAIRAALTGHLVFSTLHTNDAPSAFTRLIDMGIEPFLVASSVEAVMAQRLVRNICQHCKVEQKVERDYLRKIGFPAADIETAQFWRGAGCEECRQLGYQGRQGIYELLILNEALRPLILNRAAASTIAQKAAEGGMRTLRTDGGTRSRPARPPLRKCCASRRSRSTWTRCRMIPRPGMSSPTASPITPLKWLTGTLGVLLLLGSLAGFAYTGNSAWKLWQQTHPKAVSGKAAPAGTNAIRAARGTMPCACRWGRTQPQWPLPNRWRPKSPSMSSPNWARGSWGNHCFSLAIRLLQMDEKSRLLPLSPSPRPRASAARPTGAGSPAMCCSSARKRGGSGLLARAKTASI